MTFTPKYFGHTKQNKVDLPAISSFKDTIIHLPIHSSIHHSCMYLFSKGHELGSPSVVGNNAENYVAWHISPLSQLHSSSQVSIHSFSRVRENIALDEWWERWRVFEAKTVPVIRAFRTAMEIEVQWTACLYLSIHMLKPSSQWDGILKWGLWEVISIRCCHEGGTPMMWLVPFKEEEEGTWLLLWCVKMQQEVGPL